MEKLKLKIPRVKHKQSTCKSKKMHSFNLKSYKTVQIKPEQEINDEIDKVNNQDIIPAFALDKKAARINRKNLHRFVTSLKSERSTPLKSGRINNPTVVIQEFSGLDKR